MRAESYDQALINCGTSRFLKKFFFVFNPTYILVLDIRIATLGLIKYYIYLHTFLSDWFNKLPCWEMRTFDKGGPT